MSETLYLRADADHRIAIGHAMRCLALAEAWLDRCARGGADCGPAGSNNRRRAVMIGRIEMPDLRQRIEQASIELIAPEGTSQWSDGRPPRPPAHASGSVRPWLVVDGYQFDADYCRRMREAGYRVLRIDDTADAPVVADLVLHPSLTLDERDYFPLVEPTVPLLLGPRFAPLRAEFAANKNQSRTGATVSAVARSSSVTRMLITCGGTDPTNLSGETLRALDRLGCGSLHVRLLVGPGNNLADALAEQAQRCPADVQLVHHPADMAAQMAWADLAVAAAGSTCWELCAMGVPMIVRAVAENQRPVARGLEAAGAAWISGTEDELSSMLAQLIGDAERRAAMAEASRRLVDGQGAQRVVTIMRTMDRSQAGQVVIRPLDPQRDIWPLWRLAHEPEVRAASLGQGTGADDGSPRWIPPEEHQRWFRSRVDDLGCRIWVADLQGLLVGSVRYERQVPAEHDQPGVLEVSIQVGAAWRRRGIARGLIEQTLQRACEPTDAGTVEAIVRRENAASVALFQQLAFQEVEPRVVNDCPCRVFRKKLGHWQDASGTRDSRHVQDASGSPGATQDASGTPRSNPGKKAAGPDLALPSGGQLPFGTRPDGSAYIVAELSGNHLGDYSRAERLVHVAAEAGADAVKLQTLTPEGITLDCDRPPFRIDSGPWVGRTLFDLYAEVAMPWPWQPRLKRVADRLGIALFSSPFEPAAVGFLEGLDVPAYKIASFEIVDHELLRCVAGTGRPMILSTGAADEPDIHEALHLIREVRRSHAEKLASMHPPATSPPTPPVFLLHCVSSYPAAVERMRLEVIPWLAARFGVPVGLSDHSLSLDVPAEAARLGARMIEKHLTLSRADGGPDAGFSLEPAEFAAMVRRVRATRAEASTTKGNSVDLKADPLGIFSAPTAEALRFRRSLFVVRDVAAGERLAAEHVRAIRPGNGLHPRCLTEVLGCLTVRSIPRGTPLKWELIAIDGSICCK